MPEIPLCGPAYKLESPNVSPDEIINLYLETVQRGVRAGKLRLRNIPGMKLYKTLATGPVRQLWSNATTCFAVGGNTLWEIFDDNVGGVPNNASNLNVGTLENGPHTADIASNGNSLAISSNNKLYLALGVGFGIIPIIDTTGAPVLASAVNFIGQYFIASINGTRQIMISNLAPDGGTWDPGNVAFKEAYSDIIRRVWVDTPGGQYVWLFGSDTTEIWVQTADLFPFQRIQSGVLSIGCDSEWSVAGVAGNRFWLWHGTIWWAAGLSPEPVSDYAVEQAIMGYSQFDQSNAEAFAWIDSGHIFYAISFPQANVTWVFDLKEKAWAKRAYFSNGQFSRYRARVYTRAFKKHLVGDYETGDIYELDPQTFYDAHGALLVRDRIVYVGNDSMKMVRLGDLTVDMDTGVGLSVAEGQPGYDPQLIMRYSDDRGKTWSNERQESVGKIGETERRVVFPQMGSSRIGTALWLRMTDPVPTSYNTAYLGATPSIRPSR